MKLSALPAASALNEYFLEARSKLLDLAGILDRIDRGSAGKELADPRLQKLRQAAAILMESEPGRAEKIQRLFSLDYNPAWEKPRPR